MAANIMHPSREKPYASIVESQLFLILLIAKSAEIVIGLISGGIGGFVSQILPIAVLIMLILAYRKSSSGATGLKIVTTIEFWLLLVVGLIIMLPVLVIGFRILGEDGGGVAFLALLVTLLLVFGGTFLRLVYLRSISRVSADVESWFTGTPQPSRVQCSLSTICIIEIVLLVLQSIIPLFSSIGTGILGNLAYQVPGDLGDNYVYRSIVSMFLGRSVSLVLIAGVCGIVKYIAIMKLYGIYIGEQPGAAIAPVPDPAGNGPERKPQNADTERTGVRVKPAPRQDSRMFTVILCQVSPVAGRVYKAPMSRQLVIGRSSTRADLVLADDPSISGEHCRLDVRDRHMYIEDLGSHNGTYLNGQKIHTPKPLSRGDKLKIGKSTFTIEWQA